MPSEPDIYLIEDYDKTSAAFESDLRQAGFRPARFRVPEDFPSTISLSVRAVVCDLYFGDGQLEESDRRRSELPIHMKYIDLILIYLPRVIRHIIASIPSDLSAPLNVPNCVFVYSLAKTAKTFEEAPCIWIKRRHAPYRQLMQMQLRKLDQAQRIPEYVKWAESSKTSLTLKAVLSVPPIDLITSVLKYYGVSKEHIFGKYDKEQKVALLAELNKLLLRG